MLQRVFKAFQYRDFRLMWIGACTSSLGTWMQKVAQAWLVYEVSDSKFLLALDAFLSEIPIFLFSLVGGVVADRIERRKVLLASQWVQMGCATLLALLVGFGVVRIWQILTLSFITGLAQAFGGPAYQALIPTLVDKEDMPNAIALNSMQFNAAVMVGPALAGVVLARFGTTWCFAVNAVSFLGPIVALLLLRARFYPQPTRETILASMKHGFRFIRRQGAMEALIVLAFVMTFLAVPMRTFLPVYAKDVFHRGAGTYALFLSLSGVGSIVGALAVAAMGNVKRGQAALAMLICLGGSIAVFALSTSLVLSCIMMFISGVAMIAVFANVNSLVQLIVTDDMRGRVMSVYNFAFRGGMPMGNLTTGWLVPIFSAPIVVSVSGVLLIAVALYFLLAQRRVAAL